MNKTTIILFFFTTIIATGVISIRRKKERTTIKHDCDENIEHLKTIVPTRYFYCISTRDELPEWDPIKFADELLSDAKKRVELYMGVEIPLSMESGQKDIARYVYAIERSNYTHLSATLNQMIFILNTLGKPYPDLLQICHKINVMRQQIKNTNKKREFFCAANLFPTRFEKACRLAYGGSIPLHERDSLTWTEVKRVFCYEVEELLR